MIDTIPVPWLEAARAWAPYVLAYLALATALVHVLRPIARAIQRWTIVSSVTWDDAPARRVADAIDWLCDVSLVVLSMLPRLAVGGGRAPRSDPPSGDAR